jgi:glycosyltransferase involved in cell wall biosynthesis
MTSTPRAEISLQPRRRRGFSVSVNVVHVFPYSIRVSGGHTNAIRAFITSQRRAGINAVGLAPGPDAPAPAASFEFPLVELDSPWPRRWETIALALGIGRDRTLLNFHSINHRLAPLMRDLRRVGVPYVLTAHGQLGIQTVGRWFKKFLYLNLVDRQPRQAAGLHVLTGAVAHKLKYVMPGYQGAILVQGNLITPPDLVAIPAAARNEYGIPPEAFILLFLGRLDVPIKGLDLVVAALAQLPANQFCLVLAGPDWQNGKAQLEALANRFGCRKQIRFLGPIYGDKKWELLRLADVYISPSRREAFSVALTEAMACGLPVITSQNVDAAPDLMAAGAALVCPANAAALAKAIVKLATDPAGRRTLGGQGKSWVEAHCNANFAGERFRTFYSSILDRQSAANRR